MATLYGQDFSEICLLTVLMGAPAGVCRPIRRGTPYSVAYPVDKN